MSLSEHCRNSKTADYDEGFCPGWFIRSKYPWNDEDTDGAFLRIVGKQSSQKNAHAENLIAFLL